MYVLNDKNDSYFSGMFQHNQARAHMATAITELLEEYNINFIEWPPKGADLSPIEFCFGAIQR
jgi:transposase